MKGAPAASGTRGKGGMGVKAQQIGAIRIEKVSEIERLAVEPTFLFGNITPEIIARHRDWLGRRLIDFETGRLILSFHSYLVRTPHHVILVDTCNGNHKDRPSMPAWHMLDTSYLANLARLGVAPEDVDYVLCTHLHADHVGWNTKLTDGKWVPIFPRARYLMARTEFEHFDSMQRRNPDLAVNRGSFLDSVLPVVAHGQAELVEDTHAIERHLEDGIWLESAPGHSPGNVNVHVRSGGRHALMSGDVIHHPIQFAEPELANPADIDKALALRTRLDVIRRYTDTETLLLPAHFPEPTAGWIRSHGDRFRFRFDAEAEAVA
jgi:glyoxylase-like metal-dependent hydrolase (beta-lactamase superfamily II)